MSKDREPKPPKEPTERVVMLWPTDLKNRVRLAGGPRGMTDYVINAVEAYMKEHPPVHTHQPLKETRVGDRRIENVSLPSQPVPPEPELLAPAPDAEACPRCGEPLVGGECWTCGT